MRTGAYVNKMKVSKFPGLELQVDVSHLHEHQELNLGPLQSSKSSYLLSHLSSPQLPSNNDSHLLFISKDAYRCKTSCE